MSEASRVSRQVGPVPLRTALELRSGTLPRPLTSFIGREREQRELTEMIEQEDTRLVTLIGPGGVGKTRLALQVAEDARARFDLVHFVPLVATTDSGQIVPSIAQAIGVREPSLERIAEQVAGLAWLLVLDNLEQIPNPAPTLALLLTACTSLMILATSRTVLRLSGEAVYPVPPFYTAATPEEGAPNALAESHAVRLFAVRAHAADPSFQMNDTTVAEVAQICERLDGLPLAIELAAAQMRVLSPHAVLQRIDERLDLLTHGPEDQPKRLQSLDSAIRWSYDLLSPAEQRFFRQLGVFTSGFSEDAAQQICAPEGGRALPVLAALVDDSLLQRSVRPDGESRYYLLETIREFCQRELRVHGEYDRARADHACYFLQMGASAAPQLIVIGSAEWVERLALEHANLRDAVEWSLGEDEPEPVLMLAGTLLSQAYAQGEPSEGLDWLERALAADRQPPRALTCDALFTTSALAQVQGDFDRSIDRTNESLQVARAIGYPFGEGRALLGLGITAEWQQDLDLAERRYRAALEAMRGSESPARLAHWTVLPLANLADIALIRGDYPAAIELGLQATARWREAGYLWGIAQAMGTVAAASCELGEIAAARSAYQEVLDLWIACADGRGIAGTIAGIAAVAQKRGDHAAATRLIDAAWAARDTLGLRYLSHHLYCEQVRATVIARRPPDSLATANAPEARVSLEEAIVEARQVLAAEHPSERRRFDPRSLTEREHEVLRCIVDGQHDREIADALCISPRTVQTHVAAIMTKLDARSRAEASAIAIRNGLL